jgi:LAO/AO transport system kinase
MPEVLCYSGYYELGIAEVWEMIERYFEFVKGNGYFERKRQEQARYWMYETINEKLRNHFYNNPDVASLLNDKEQRVLNNQQSSFTAARDVLDFYFKTLTGK